jgi:hypothetical protein
LHSRAFVCMLVRMRMCIHLGSSSGLKDLLWLHSEPASCSSVIVAYEGRLRKTAREKTRRASSSNGVTRPSKTDALDLEDYSSVERENAATSCAAHDAAVAGSCAYLWGA